MKKENLHDLNLKQIEEKVVEDKKKLLDLRIEAANRKLKNTHEITRLRKEVAHLKTMETLKERELELAVLTKKEDKE